MVPRPVWDAGEHVVHDCARFFAAWVIAGQVEPIGELRRDGSHLGAFSPIAVAAAAEDDRNGAGGRLAQRS